MQLTYDHVADALYMQLADKPIVRTQRINANFLLDLDENNQVVGVEVLNVRKAGIDPLTLTTVHYTSGQEAERPDPEAMKARRAAKMEALRQRKATEKE